MRIVGLTSIFIGGCWALILGCVFAYQRTAPSTAMWLYFTVHQGIDSEIYRVHPHTHQLTNLTQYEGVDNLVSISEDGEWLIFTSDRAQTGSLDMHRMDLRGNHVQRIDYQNPHFQRMSPDEQWQAESAVVDGNLEIVLRGRFTGEVRQITHNSIPDYEPAWSANSQLLAYISTPYGNADIFVVEPDGSNRERLTSSPYLESTPTWSPLIDYSWHRDNWLLASLLAIGSTLLSNILWRRWHG